MAPVSESAALDGEPPRQPRGLRPPEPTGRWLRAGPDKTPLPHSSEA